MSTIPHEAASLKVSPTNEPLAKLVFDHPGADIILRSQDCYHLRAPKITIVNNSSILGKIIKSTIDSLGDANAEANLPVVELPESGEILHFLLTFVFPVTPLIPSTPEDTMELLSVAKKYQMGSVLTHIRASIAQQNSFPTGLKPALHTYALAQNHGLLPEALQAARTILNYPITIEDFDNNLDIMSGACLYELWTYYESVRAILRLDLEEFRMSRARRASTGFCCTQLSRFHIPSWLDQYIESIGDAPHLFDYAELNIAMVRHVKDEPDCDCASVPSQTIRDFWKALESVVRGSFEKVSTVEDYRATLMLDALQAEPALCLVPGQEVPEVQINPATSPLGLFDVPDANLIIRSSDFVNFRVHKTVLAMASPLFKALLSLPQPPDSETVDGLPLVQLPEDSELLNGLISILYRVPMAIPESYDKVLYCLRLVSQL